ncbi:hypothetical protein E7744_12170 [Citricoccus sp. SGAir0253]|uniref:hypothetical protein n=1 Tax=Citricoccus sp. SGAir0253 TaxID=2567881 RepID=UPI0010CCB660|nr:hypothetical protein [Citricoccus sp. SGAir0253]QCU78809.1 hypothetical protein E7744_12170 [Citricoccus sp. SGAir0253]
MDLPASVPDIVTVAEARELGIGRRRLQGARAERHLHGLYSPERRARDEAELHLSLLRATTAAGADVASHGSAALVWGFPGARVPEELHLLSVAGDRRSRVRGTTGRRGLVLPSEVVRVGGIAVTTPGRTWLDLARAAGERRLVLWADWLFNPVWGGQWDRLPLSTPERLRDLLAAHRGKPGIRRARLALDRARVGSDSPQETSLRLALVDAGLPEPAVNQWIVHPLTGERLHRGDLTYQDLRIDLEYDGEHHSGPLQVQRDIERAERLQSVDWMELRFSARHARDDWAPAVRKTRAALLARGWTPGSPA